MPNTIASGLAYGGSNPYLAQAYLVAKVGEVAADTMKMFPKIWIQSTVGQSTLSAQFRVRNPFANASSVTEAAALTTVAWAPTGAVIASALDGFSVVEGKQLNGLAPEILGEIAQDGGAALGRTMDSAVSALFSTLTGGTVGTTATALTLDNALLADANLDAATFDAGGTRYGFIHPHQFYNLRQSIKSANFGVGLIQVDGEGNETISIGSITFQKTTLLSKINTNADWAGAVFCSEAIGGVIGQNPTVEILEIPGSHAYSIDCTVSFGVGLVRPTFGCLVQSGINA